MTEELGRIEFIELGMRDYNDKIYAKAHFTQRNDWKAMMVDGTEEFTWKKHIAGKKINIPGGCLYPCSPNCDCLNEILRRVDDIDHEVNRIASENRANADNAKASLFLHAYRCKPHEAAERMGIDDVMHVVHMAQEFRRETTNPESVFEEMESDTVLQLENHV